jgi:maltose/moltooligosaccharide transporter
VNIESTEFPVAAQKAQSRLSLAAMCCGLFGVQIVWALQNVNTSRIFQTLGASMDELPMLWIAAPISGLLIQPIVGHLSDRTKGRLGRRKPYIIAGAIVSAAALVLMPNSPTLWAASIMLWLLSAAINVAMEPFRALVADIVPERQRNTAFAMQVAFIGSGAVFASALPWILTNGFGLGGSGDLHTLPQSVRVAFYVGAGGLLLTVGVTILTTKSQQPSGRSERGQCAPAPRRAFESSTLVRNGAACVIGAVVLALVTALGHYRRELYVISGLVMVLGIGQWAAAWSAWRGRRPAGLLEIVHDVLLMPAVLRRLGLVQFFTWFGLFTLWIYAVPAVALRTGAGQIPSSAGYNEAANWVGILFAFYNGVAAFGALLLPILAARIGRREAHAACLGLGALGLLGFAFVSDRTLLLIPAFAIGCAWTSILSAPYAMVASAVPADRVGVYMGIHNVFLVLPQLVAAALLGWIVDAVLGGRADFALALAAVAFAIAAVTALTIPRRMEEAAF